MNSTAELTVGRVVVENWETNGVGTPKEEVVRQATVQGISKKEAAEAVESLRLQGDVYEIRCGVLCPVDKPRMMLG